MNTNRFATILEVCAAASIGAIVADGWQALAVAILLWALINVSPRVRQ